MFNVLPNRKAKFWITALAVAAVTMVANVPAHAALVLTAAGISDGFTLSTYAPSGASGVGYPFLAAAPVSGGNLAVVYQQSELRLYSDVNGQTTTSFSSSVSLPNVINIANAGGNTYASVLGGGLYKVSPSLGLTPVSVPGFTFGYGLAGNPVTGHLLAAGSSVNGIYDINPLTGAVTTIYNGGFIDGVSVSPDGTTVYGAGSGQVLGFKIAAPPNTNVFTYNSPDSPDGTGVISGGTFNGYVIANNNDGTVSLIDPTGTTATIIANGGSRGDFTSPDTNDGSLLLAYSGAPWMYRLNAPGGSFGGGGGGAVPEPTSIATFSIMTVCATVYGWRRRKLARP